MALLECRELELTSGRRDLVSGFDLALERGQAIGVVGGIGSGKTLLALTCAGLPPAGIRISGSLEFSGRRAGLLWPDPAERLDPLMEVGAQLAEALELGGKASSGNLPVDELLVEVGLAPSVRTRFPQSLSLVERQLVLLAMVLAGEPDLLVCDEPTKWLDATGRRLVLDGIRGALARRDAALLVFSQSVSVVAALASEVIVLASGKVLQRGPLAELVGRPGPELSRRLLNGAPGDRVPVAHATGEKLVEVRNVTRRFHSPAARPWHKQAPPALDGVSFDISRGEAVAIVGNAGAGKSTLARLIAGLGPTGSGELRLEGQPYRGSDPPPGLRARISMIFPDPEAAFDQHLPVGTSLAQALRLDEQLILEEQADRLVEAMRSVGLAPADLARLPSEFSVADLQRLALARALIGRPSLLVLDDPLSRLGPLERQDLSRLINRLRADYRLTLLITARDVELVHSIADRVLVLERGKLAEDDTSARLAAESAPAVTAPLADAPAEQEIGEPAPVPTPQDPAAANDPPASPPPGPDLPDRAPTSSEDEEQVEVQEQVADEAIGVGLEEPDPVPPS